MGRLTKYGKTSHDNKVCCTHFMSVECRAVGGDCAYGCRWEEEAWSKLAHYEDMEEQGRLIELPCAVGDTVWWISSKKVKRGRIVEIDWNNAAFAFFVESDYFVRFTLQEYEVYFTKEEAEAKLKELEE